MKIPGYSIERLIGKGGMASVYLAVQESLNRRVALKVMKKFDDEQRAERFLHEGRVIASLNHRNIITIHDIGTIEDRHYIAMEYLQGRSLTERIDEGVSLSKALSLLEQMAACLHFVHRRGIIHRDIKPSNILFHADGTPKLTDFGIAKLVDTDQELTLEGKALGSPYYLSPEQAEGIPLDGRSDIYSLGIVFYQMLTGQRPYARSSVVETIVAHLTQPLPVLPERYLAYQGLLESMIAKQRDDRVSTAKELAYRVRAAKRLVPLDDVADDAVAIEQVDAPHPPPADDVTPPPHRWVNAALSIFAVVGVVSVLAMSWDTEDAPLPPTSATLPPQVEVTAQTTGSALEKVEETIERPEVIESEEPSVEVPLLDTAALEADVQPEVPAITEVLASEAEGVPEAVVAEEETTPESEHTVNAETDQIDGWLQAAERARERLRLTRPADDNAYAYYKKVLALDAEHPGALAGIQAIADRYAGMARKALNKGDDKRANRYVRRGIEVRPGDPQLADLRAELDERAHEQVALNEISEPPQPVAPAQEPPQQQSVRGREGTGNIVKDFQSVWRSVFK